MDDHLPVMPLRTGKTDLSTDELLLLDFLALLGPAKAKQLWSADYPFHVNCHYTHSIQDDDVEVELLRLSGRGIVRALLDPVTHINWFQLTCIGGEAWEAERRPVWPCYCQHLVPTGGKEWTLTVLSVQPEIGLACLSACGECGVYPAQEGIVSTQLLPGDELLDWKTFAAVWCSEVSLLAEPGLDSAFPTDWEAYERKRTWWSTLDELQLFITG